MTFFEDYAEGDSHEIGTHVFEADEIVAFASAWDPHPFHVDADEARKSLFGGLCASGWHTACAWMRLNVAFQRRLLADARAAADTSPATGPSPGFTDLVWKQPVYAGERLTFRNTVCSKRRLASCPGWGLVTLRAEGFKDDGTLAFAFDGKMMVECREGA